jgi:hypothetical protein
LYLGERIPADGTEADTLFTDAELSQLITDSSGDWSNVLSDGWAAKVAAYAGLVDTAEGTAKRALSDLHEHALKMAEFYQPGGTGGSTQAKIHQIVRR